jgi:hypothetical protein
MMELLAAIIRLLAMNCCIGGAANARKIAATASAIMVSNKVKPLHRETGAGC